MSDRAKILAGPCYIYAAPKGTAKPTPVPDDRGSLPSDWELIAEGDYDSAIEMNFSQSKNDVRTMNETFKVKKFRAEEGITYTTRMLDMTVESLEYVFDNQTIDETVGDIWCGWLPGA